jgi:hypothetical protein
LFLAGRLDITAEGVECPEQFAMLVRHRAPWHVGDFPTLVTLEPVSERTSWG